MRCLTKICLSFAFLALLCSPARADGIFFEVEPNDSYETAQNLGALTTSITVLNSSLVLPPQQDYFLVALSYGYRVTVSATGGSFTAITIINPAMMGIASSGFSSNPLISDFFIDASGLWGIRVVDIGTTPYQTLSITATPTPEAATMLLFGTGLTGIGVALRKRRKHAEAA
jgi:hypothetical protein